ncbi:MAG: hypothetical protein QNJ65_17055 [Xenococcaceae cyanobacterium MO_234.B1]|nr:hypothetical protein [Xenococcaceae cyanobacterium MO_234.B1]
MRLIKGGAISQPQLLTLELTEQEIMNMYQNKPCRSCRLGVPLVQKPSQIKRSGTPVKPSALTVRKRKLNLI